jgi:polyphosphate kinase
MGSHRPTTSTQRESSPVETIDQMQDDLPYDERIGKKEYRRELEALQIELLKAQRHIRAVGDRVVIVFEGRDAAGKGGSIKRFRQHLNPRGGEHVALAKPNEAEQTQWYFQRYVAHLPSAGEITMFDRSWYNRAGVEKVMGFCTPQEHALFLRQVPDFEQSLVGSGIQLFKLWFTVSKDRQKQRFDERREDPLKHWKMSPIDEVSVEKYDEYTEARNEMLLATDTVMAPWTIVNSNEKRRARLGAIRSVLHSLDYEHKDLDVAGEPDPRVVRTARSVFIGN